MSTKVSSQFQTRNLFYIILDGSLSLNVFIIFCWLIYTFNRSYKKCIHMLPVNLYYEHTKHITKSVYGIILEYYWTGNLFHRDGTTVEIIYSNHYLKYIFKYMEKIYLLIVCCSWSGKGANAKNGMKPFKEYSQKTLG